MLLEMKEEIHDDLKRFQGFAEKYSQCPSKTQKGDLGRFKPGDMAPPFDKAVFQPSSPLETTIGPIQTQFGYHLIYIRERKI
jgi:peptidyl-prolyl cis-trans isomerase C